MNRLTNYSTKTIFSRLLKNKSQRNYWNYVSELRKRKTEFIFERSVQLTKSKVLEERILGVDILSQLGYPRLHKKEVINILFHLLKTETDRKIISTLLYGISHNNEKISNEKIDLICSFKNHNSVIVRHSLTHALCTLENEKAIHTLIKLSNDKDADVRDWATFGLGSQLEIDNEKIRNALWNRVTDETEGARFEAISGLAQRQDSRIKEILIKELGHINEHGSLILESIEQLKDKSMIPYLEKQIVINKRSKKVNEQWLLNTINTLKGIEI